MKQVFYDPQLKRWRRLRRVLDVTGVVSTVVLVIFFLSVIEQQRLPDLFLPTQKRNYKALKETHIGDQLRKNAARSSRRKTFRRPSEVPLNTDEGLRAAFYMNDDASYSSLKAHLHQIDMLFPDWLHVVADNGNLIASTALFPVRLYNVVDKNGVHGVDPEDKVHRLLTVTKDDMEVFPMLNDYNPLSSTWDGDVIGHMLESPAARANRLVRKVSAA